MKTICFQFVNVKLHVHKWHRRVNKKKSAKFLPPWLCLFHITAKAKLTHQKCALFLLFSRTHPAGFMSNLNMFSTHGSSCAPLINSSKVMWPVKAERVVFNVVFLYFFYYIATLFSHHLGQSRQHLVFVPQPRQLKVVSRSCLSLSTFWSDRYSGIIIKKTWNCRKYI